MNDRIYTDLAHRYTASSAPGPVNELYDRPTILELAGPLAGRDVLELGCAGGHLTERLLLAGARVVALDKSEQMVAIARQRSGDRARVERADLNDPLVMVADASADVVTASLVLHYLPDWTTVLSEVHRALRPGGVLVLSLHHPITGWLLSDRTDYHRTELVGESWTVGGVPVVAEMWRRPLQDVFTPLLDQGLVVDAVREPTLALGEDVVADERTRHALASAPVFLFVRASRPAGAETAGGPAPSAPRT